VTLSDQAAWYVVHSKPKCEHLAALAAAELPGVEAYCPRIRFRRTTRRGAVWFVEALFPGYFFARFAPAASLRAVRHARQVIRVVEFGGQPVPVPDVVLVSLREEMRGLDVREVEAGVCPGDEVELAAGPMRGLRGIVDSVRDGAQRVRILMEFLGRDNLVEVDAGKLLGGQRPRDRLAAGG
jgi:transcriptional antiterminator RfaH